LISFHAPQLHLNLSQPASTMNKLLVGNRGEMAPRIIRTAKVEGILTVAIYTSSDKLSPHVALTTKHSSSRRDLTILSVPARSQPLAVMAAKKRPFPMSERAVI
jgi:hypothetical protein